MLFRSGLHLAEGSKIGWGEASKAAIDADLQKMFMYESETAIGVRAYCQKAIRATFVNIIYPVFSILAFC